MSQLHVICKIDGGEYAIPASDVLQMDIFEGATAIPGTAPYVRGLTQVRQQVVPVIDARLRFGLPPAPVTSESRLIILKLEKRLVGLLVDTAREVRNIAPESFLPAPEVLSQNTANFVSAVAQIKGKIIMLIDSFKLAGEDRSHD